MLLSRKTAKQITYFIFETYQYDKRKGSCSLHMVQIALPKR